MQNVLGYLGSRLGFQALLKIQYSCRLGQSNTQQEREMAEIQKKTKGLLPKWKMLLSICICSSIHFTPKLKRTIKINVLAATSQCVALSHHKALIISSFCWLNTGRRWGKDGSSWSLPSQIPPGQLVLFPGVKLLSKERKSFIFSSSHLQENLT